MSETRKYYAKLTLLQGHVSAEIYHISGAMELIVVTKWFGCNALNAPKDKHYKKAIKWLERQIDRIQANTYIEVERLYKIQNYDGYRDKNATEIYIGNKPKLPSCPKARKITTEG